MIAGALCAQDLTIPAWLTPLPGAQVRTEAAPGLAQVSYRAAAKPDDVIEHYRKVWAPGQPFIPNFNGTGTSIRAAAPECDVLVQIREDGDGSFVKASCASKTTVANPAAAPEVVSSSGSRRPGFPSLPRPDFSKRDPHTAAVLAEAEARHRAGVNRMADYDKPVYPRPPQDPPGIPLAWPSWLVHMPGASRDLEIEEKVDRAGKKYLMSRFRTTKPMTSIHVYYEDLLNAHGYRVGQSKLETGHTLSGVTQNKNGMVKGSCQPNGIGGGGVEIEVDFYRSALNDPIQVTIKVELIQIYSPRR